MNEQSHDQPGLAQPGPAQRDPGHQGSAQQPPAQKGGVEKTDSQQGDSQRGEAQDASHGSHQVKPQGGEPAGNASLPSNAAAGGKRTGVKNEAVAGPFTVRDLTVFAATLVLFIASLIPMFAFRYNLWNLGSLFFLGLGIVLPLIVAALFVARRLAPETKVRIGSLSIDQFGSVVASFAVAFFFLSIAGAFTPSLLVALIGSLVLLAATVLAPFIPFFAGDFLYRAEVPAHVMARESAVPVQKPKAPKPAKPSDAKPADAKPSVQGSSVQASSVQGPTAGGHYAAGQTFGASPVAGSHDTGKAAGVAAAPSPGAWSSTNAAAASPATQAAAVVPSAEASGAEASAVRPAVAEAAFPAAEETELDGTPVDGTPANGGPANGTPAKGAPAAAGATAAASAVQASSATPATAVHPQVKAQEPLKSQEPIGATVDPASRPEETEQPPAHEAFWFAVAQHRTAVDERTGAPLFGIEPGGWVLALEDRGDEFLVQHTDGRVGVLRDLSNIERG